MVATTNSAATMPTYTILKKTVVPHALTSRASAGFHVRLVFRLCSTLKRLLICVCRQWPGCLRAIMEFTAAGQLEIHTHIPN